MALLGIPRAYLGLDIGTTNIKLVELLDRGKRHELSTYAYAPRTRSIKTGAIISRMLEAAQTSADDLIISLPNKAIFCVKLTLPDLPEDELAAAVKFKAREVVPLSLDDVELAWYKQPDGVYLVATAKTVIAQYRRLAERLGLKLVGTEAEIFSLMRTHTINTGQNTIFCNIGGQETTLHLIKHGFPCSSSTIPGGSQSIDSLFQEVEHIAAGLRVTKTILVGGGINLASFKNRWIKQFGHQPSISNPWQSLSFQEGLEGKLVNLGPLLAVAVGLARSKLSVL
ncbi:MAG: pilus assembly protein PilM [bacterium]